MNEELELRVLSVRGAVAALTRAAATGNAGTGTKLAAAITECFRTRTNPMPWPLWLNLYMCALGTLDEDSLLRKMIIAYLSTCNYAEEVVVLTTPASQQMRKLDRKLRATRAQLDATRKQSRREPRRGDIAGHLRTYAPIELTYKWICTCMCVTLPKIIRDIIACHDFAAMSGAHMRGANCGVVQKCDMFGRFVELYEQKYGRSYFAALTLTAADLYALMHAVICAELGTRVDAASGRIHVNLPRDRPAYTLAYTNARTNLKTVKERIMRGFSTRMVTPVRDSELVIHEAELIAPMSADADADTTPRAALRAGSIKLGTLRAGAPAAPAALTSARSEASDASSDASSTYSHSTTSSCTTCRERMDTGRASGANTSRTPRARPANTPADTGVQAVNTGSRPVNTPADTDFRAEHIDLSQFAHVDTDATMVAGVNGYVINISGGSVTINLYCDN